MPRSNRFTTDRKRTHVRIKKPRPAGPRLAKMLGVPLGAPVRIKFNPNSRRTKFPSDAPETAGLKVRVRDGNLPAAFKRLAQMGNRENSKRPKPRNVRQAWTADGKWNSKK
jgi:hypothetical protein